MSAKSNAAKPGAEVRLTGVAKRYGKVTAVKPLDLVIAPGSLVTLLGPSGCGKTTLLRMIAGLERASEGRIMIGGRDVTDLSAGERNVSMVFQSYALFPHMSVRDNVAFGLVSGGMPKAEAHAKAEDALATVGLKGLGDRLPSEMSGGQQQRVALARALVLEPDVLLFDEPLSNLDAKLRRKVRDDIRDLQQRLGLTVLYVTHDQQEALAVSDKVIVMDNAVIAQEGTPSDLYERPRTRFLADFIGEANIVEGSFGRDASGVTFTAGGAHFSLGDVPVPEGAKAAALRPDRVNLVLDPNGAFTIRRVAYVGPAREYLIDAPWGEMLVIRPVRERAIPAGTKVSLEVDPGAAIAIPG